MDSDLIDLAAMIIAGAVAALVAFVTQPLRRWLDAKAGHERRLPPDVVVRYSDPGDLPAPEVAANVVAAARAPIPEDVPLAVRRYLEETET